MENSINSQSMLPIGTLLQGGKYRIDRYLSSVYPFSPFSRICNAAAFGRCIFNATVSTTLVIMPYLKRRFSCLKCRFDLLKTPTSVPESAVLTT